jgi:hypothetical protein
MTSPELAKAIVAEIGGTRDDEHARIAFARLVERDGVTLGPIRYRSEGEKHIWEADIIE